MECPICGDMSGFRVARRIIETANNYLALKGIEPLVLSCFLQQGNRSWSYPMYDAFSKDQYKSSISSHTHRASLTEFVGGQNSLSTYSRYSNSINNRYINSKFPYLHILWWPAISRIVKFGWCYNGMELQQNSSCHRLPRPPMQRFQPQTIVSLTRPYKDIPYPEKDNPQIGSIWQ